MNRYTKTAAINNIRDYYSPLPSENALGKNVEVFERAKQQYINALENQIQAAKQISFSDVFPKRNLNATSMF